MTPKEKAQELVNKFLIEVRGADRYNYNLESMNLFIAKQCALITVDEIIKASPTNPTMDGIEEAQGHFTLYAAEALIFWEQVKTEIDKL